MCSGFTNMHIHKDIEEKNPYFGYIIQNMERKNRKRQYN